MDENGLSNQIIGAAIEVHKQLGRGLLESVYEECMAFEFAARDILFERQMALPVIYKGNKIECGFRIDLLVGGLVFEEFKSVDTLLPVHSAQVITYLKLTGCKLWMLFNFNVIRMKDGIKRIALGLNEKPSM